MRAADVDILVVPGYGGSGPDHWQTRWERKLSTARRVEQADWHRPSREAWCANLLEHVKAARRPVVLVAHSCGVITAVQVARHTVGTVRAAFLVAPPDFSGAALPEACRALAPIPRDPLPFPAFLIASRSDPYCRFEVAEELAQDWRALLIDSGNAGHVNTQSGHGPWPEGILLFSRLLRNLSA